MTETITPSDPPLMLSVSGARGIVGQTMTPSIASDYAAAFGSFLTEAASHDRPIVCIGHDSRPSGAMLADAAISGLTAVGCRVIELGVVATPTVAVMIDHHHAHGGLVITASHNPIQWNGIKCLNADGVAPPPDDAQKIIRRYKQHELTYVPAENVTPRETDSSGNDTHIKRVLHHVDISKIGAAKFKVVLDSVNGAGCVAGRQLLETLGCKVVHINGEPTGYFAHTPEPTESNLQDLAQITASEHAACGFAQDPDADRLAIIDNTGRYIGEEYTLVLAAKRLLDLQGGGPIAVNLSTSRMIDDLAAMYPGATVIRSSVGEANVVAALKPANGILGGEGNGGVIFPPVCWVRDSLSSMALVLGLMADQQRSLSEIVNDLPRYEMIKHKIDLADVGGRDVIEKAIEKVTKHYINEKLNTSDGVRVDLADGWVHLRPSNTEPIVRLIAEAKTKDRAQKLLDDVAGVAGLR